MEIRDTGEPLAPQAAPRNTRKRSIIIFTITSTLCLGLLALLWVQLLTPAQQSQGMSQNSNTTSSESTINDPLIGQTAPNFTLLSLNGPGNQKVSLTSFAGKAVVINFWSSTCAPCNDEAPLLETQWELNQAQGVVFLGIDVEDTNSDGLHFLQQHGVTYTSLIDNSGATLVSYGVTYTPETIFISRTGKVVSAIRMEITSQQLQSGLQTLLS
jgi:cytochrome c biogenesis protein CcmG, thiol:disulfide interchange protein DsbE